jgi:hypothetical protein
LFAICILLKIIINKKMKAIIIGFFGVVLSLSLILNEVWWGVFTLIFSGMVIGGGMGSEDKNDK